MRLRMSKRRGATKLPSMWSRRYVEMEAQRSKVHHYLPQFYLKRFASRKKRNTHYIWRFDKRTGDKVEIDIAKVCHEKGFHEFTDTFGNVVRFEDNITQMEHNVSKSLE